LKTAPNRVDKNSNTKLKPFLQVSKSVGRELKKVDLVIYESTVYPGCNKKYCTPVLEKLRNK
jgi:UDP-N-acetyl-D-glucosamine/UDP-N-acetyl-D-galactosamine dehydrogenase